MGITNEHLKLFKNVEIGDKCSVWRQESLVSLLNRFYAWLDLFQVWNIFAMHLRLTSHTLSCRPLCLISLGSYSFSWSNLYPLLPVSWYKHPSIIWVSPSVYVKALPFDFIYRFFNSHKQTGHSVLSLFQLDTRPRCKDNWCKNGWFLSQSVN